MMKYPLLVLAALGDQEGEMGVEIDEIRKKEFFDLNSLLNLMYEFSSEGELIHEYWPNDFLPNYVIHTEMLTP
jgi:hypothetical protein